MIVNEAELKRQAAEGARLRANMSAHHFRTNQRDDEEAKGMQSGGIVAHLNKDVAASLERARLRGAEYCKRTALRVHRGNDEKKRSAWSRRASSPTSRKGQ